MEISGIKLKEIKIKHIKQCIKDGNYCAMYKHKENWKNWIIDSINFYHNVAYNSVYGDDVYLDVKIYHTKTKNEHTFNNGFLYTTNRVLKLSDVYQYPKQ